MNLQHFIERFSVNLIQAVAWGEMDAYGHVNNIMYFRYFENIRFQYFEQVGVNDYMEKSNIGPILGSTDCRYLAPLTYPDNITVGTSVSVVREKRFTMKYSVYSQKLETLVATGNGEIIYFDYNSKLTCPIPDMIAANIKELEPLL